MSHLTSRRRVVQAGSAMAAVMTVPFVGRAFAQESTPSASPAAATPAASSVIDFTPGVIDTLLGEVTLPENPQRVLCINDGPVDTMLNLGLVPLIVGGSYGAGEAGILDYLVPYAPEGTIENVGDDADYDLERIIELKPDLIIAEGRQRFIDATTREEAEANELVQSLQRIAPLVIPKDIDTSDPLGLQYFEYSHLVWSHALGKLEEGQALLDAQHAKTEQLHTDLAAHTGETTIVFRPTDEFPLVMAQTWFTGVLLRRVGLVGNAYAESVEYPHSGSSLSMEQINELDADWIFVAPRFAAEQSADQIAVLDAYFGNPLFTSLPAIAAGHYGVVSGQLWSGANGVIAADIILDNIRSVILDGVQDQVAAAASS